MPKKQPDVHTPTRAWCGGELKHLDLIVSGSSTGGAAYAIRALQTANKYKLPVVRVGVEWGAHQGQVASTIQRQMAVIEEATLAGLSHRVEVYQIDIDG